ncbi:hypothetical protein SAMN02745127_02398 [Oceanospirillum multiglobuliferum]|uniref:Chemotaxis protein n=1 Tax=Oceanospirillum multiglobuliferum TaxID=64969 RepID=A0A1T4RIL4_9GAMM|nr:hypothetical protein [Oceanospirillum multiglobuliferum]OPX54805.1 hypothetical protein BTE48_12340 [Oceanospirillum multiglobuliferum]SKA15805.1 hypothetical protein SAMN02745127_02398 [Oceanospirillum multiglobuliferum]
MHSNRKNSAHFFINAATVAAELSVVLTEAKNISLEAMNAKALVARAGDNVRTFKPITDFMVELANDTIWLVKEINREALVLSRTSLAELHSSDAHNRFKRAQQKASLAPYGDTIDTIAAEASNTHHQQAMQLRRHMRKLFELLDEIESRMLAANVVTATSRLEAATAADSYQASLEGIVIKLEKAANRIKHIASKCRRSLER